LQRKKFFNLFRCPPPFDIRMFSDSSRSTARSINKYFIELFKKRWVICLPLDNMTGSELLIDTIFPDDMEKIINNNLKGKTMQSPRIRLLLSWLIAGPISYFLILLSINTSYFIYDFFRLNRFVNPEQLFTRFMPYLILLSTVNIIILFLLPNLVLGFLAPNWKIAILNSFIYLVITLTLYFYSIEPNFAYILIGNLPLTLIFSLFFLFLGMRYSSKKFLKD